MPPRRPGGARFIYYAIRRQDRVGELIGYVRAYSDGNQCDFDLMEDTLKSSLGMRICIDCFAESGDRWYEADSLAAIGVPIVIYDPEGRRDEHDKYSDRTECVSCDWTRLTDFPSLRATSAA